MTIYDKVSAGQNPIDFPCLTCYTAGMPETNSVPERAKQPATRFLKDVKVTLKEDTVEPVDLRSYEPVAAEHGIGIILKSQ